MIYALVKCQLVHKWARIRKEDNGVHQEQECEEIIKGLFKKTPKTNLCAGRLPYIPPTEVHPTLFTLSVH